MEGHYETSPSTISASGSRRCLAPGHVADRGGPDLSDATYHDDCSICARRPLGCGRASACRAHERRAWGARIRTEIDVAFEGSSNDEEDNLPALNETSTPVTQLGDLWLLGEHRILFLGDERAQMVFTDPRSNIPIAGPCLGPGVLAIADEVIE